MSCWIYEGVKKRPLKVLKHIGTRSAAELGIVNVWKLKWKIMLYLCLKSLKISTLFLTNDKIYFETLI